MQGKWNLTVLSAFLFISFFYKEWHSGFVSTFIFYVLTCMLCYEIIVLITAFYKLDVLRTLVKKRMFAGASQEIVVRITRKYRFPFIWYSLYESWPKGLIQPTSHVIFPWFRKEIEVRYQLEDIPRGNYEINDIVIHLGDLFGLLKGVQVFTIPDRFVVYPRYQERSEWIVKDGQRSGGASFLNRASTELTSLSGIREYQYGDRLSQIHWKATARNLTLKTKEFEFQLSNHLCLFFDTSIRGYNRPEQFEKAVSLTASLVYIGHKRQQKYSLLSGGLEQKVHYLEGNGDSDFYRFLDFLATIQLTDEFSFIHACTQKITYLPRGTHLIFITATLDRSLTVLLSDLVMKRWRVELFFVSRDLKGSDDVWLKTLRGSGVICHSEAT